MSYILEALKRADQEHDLGTVPDLTTSQESTHPEERTYPWPWIIVILLLVNAVLVAILLNNRDAVEPDASLMTQAPPERQAGPVNTKAEPPVQKLAEPLINEAPPVTEPARTATEATTTGGEVVVLPESSYLQSPEPLVVPQENADARMDATLVAEDDSPVQNWYELPLAFRNKLDLPSLDVHVYSEDPEKRFIMVDLQKFREGETLSSGLFLEEILPDGMVMSYQGERFRVGK